MKANYDFWGIDKFVTGARGPEAIRRLPVRTDLLDSWDRAALDRPNATASYRVRGTLPG